MTSLPQSKNAGAAKDGKKSGARSALPTELSGPAMGSGSRSGPICGPTRSTSRSLARLVWSWRNLCSRALSRRSCSGSRRRCHPRRTHSSCSRASSGSRQDLRLWQKLFSGLEIRRPRLCRRLRIAWRARRRPTGAGDRSKPRPIGSPASGLRAYSQAGRCRHRHRDWSECPGRTARRARAPRSRRRGTAGSSARLRPVRSSPPGQSLTLGRSYPARPGRRITARLALTVSR